MNKTLSNSLALAATAAAGLLALRGATPAPSPPAVDPEAQALLVADDYRSWGALDQPVKVAPTLCRMPPGGGKAPLGASASESGPHSVKLYRLYARDAAAYRGVESGAPQAHQVLVKEAFEPVIHEMAGPGRIPPDVVSAGGRLLRPGASAGLFMMWHDASDVAGEERWTYATVSAEGEVTATGRIESCVACHSLAPHGGLFGLEN